MIDPLMRAAIATLILDNTPHDAERARGTRSKIDLCDVMFKLTAPRKFSIDRAGRLELEITHSRLGELTGKWALELGAGSYGSWTHQTGADARAAFAAACVAALADKRLLGRDPLIAAARDRGITGDDKTFRA
jgi:hypothetical protein